MLGLSTMAGGRSLSASGPHHRRRRTPHQARQAEPRTPRHPRSRTRRIAYRRPHRPALRHWAATPVRLTRNPGESPWPPCSSRSPMPGDLRLRQPLARMQPADQRPVFQSDHFSIVDRCSLFERHICSDFNRHRHSTPSTTNAGTCNCDRVVAHPDASLRP